MALSARDVNQAIRARSKMRASTVILNRALALRESRVLWKSERRRTVVKRSDDQRAKAWRRHYLWQWLTIWSKATPNILGIVRACETA